MRLKDKVAAITGAARGIGKEIATLFAKEGASLAICDVDFHALETAAKQMESLGVDILPLEVDVSNTAAVEWMFNKILDKFEKIDILINNAGITRDSLIVRMREEDWDKVIAINLKGAFNCTRAASKIMLRQKSGKIVNIASIIGLMGNAGQANYAASKAGLIGLTKSVAKELAPRGITVNAIAPGFIQTDMTAGLPQEVKEKLFEQIPMRKLGQPADVANLALFLSSGDSNYITGQVIKIDGGLLM